MSELDDYIERAAQYIADRIDVCILLKHTLGGDAPDSAVDDHLAAVGWQGRTYPRDFFRADSIHT